MFGPRFATGLAASSNAQDILLRQAQQRLQNQDASEELKAAERARMGQMLVAEALQKVLGRSGQIPTQFSQAAPQTPQRLPQAPQQPPQQVGAGPGAIQVQPLPPAGGVGNGTTMPGAAPAAVPPGVQPAQAAAAPSPQPQAVAAQKGAQAGPPTSGTATWKAALQDIMSRPDVPDDVKFSAYQEIQKEIAAEEKRESDANQKSMERQDRLHRELTVLETRYRMAGTNEAEKLRIKGEYDQILAQLNNASREGIAAGANASRERVAGMNTGSRERIAAAQVASREGLEAAKLEYKKQFDSDTLELKADSQAKNFLLKSRQLDLMDKGLNQKQAQFVAKLEQDKEIATMRDATTQRGQSLMLERAQLAQTAKLNVEESKVAAAMPRVIDNFDKLYTDAERLLNMPGLEDATGPIDSMLLTLYGDTADFEEAVKTLQANIGFQALAEMRAASPTGGALGNVSNREVEFLQATVRSLSLRQTAEQFRENLAAIMDRANKGKALTLQAYEARFGAGKPKGGDVPAAATAPKPGGETRDIPTELKGEPNGTIVRDGAKTFMVKDGKLVETGG